VIGRRHLFPYWKSYLKGIYDAEGVSTPIIVTGSARLDLARRMGDSLAESGRVNLMVEVKWDEAIPSKNFGLLRPRGTEAPAVQVVGTLGAVNRPAPHLTILPAAEWLEDLTP
jgi:hypothetical protein